MKKYEICDENVSQYVNARQITKFSFRGEGMLKSHFPES